MYIQLHYSSRYNSNFYMIMYCTITLKVEKKVQLGYIDSYRYDGKVEKKVDGIYIHTQKLTQSK